MNTDAEKEVAFLPYHALNEFMLDDYRLEVIRSTLQALPNLPQNLREPVDQLTKKIVRVQGFRSGLKAPTQLKVKPMAEAFQKSPELVVAILAAWAEGHADLRQMVYNLLISRNWEILPVDADRTILPGFLTKWPKGEDFDTLNQAFSAMYPEVQAVSNDVSLMIVWLSGRLPYHVGDEEEE